MIEVTVGEEEIEAVDSGKNEITVTVEGWEPIDQGPTLDRDVDRRLTGSVRRIEFPEEAVSVERLDPPNLTLCDAQTAPLELDDGHYILKIEQTVIVYIATDDPCVLEEPTTAGTSGIDFQRKAPVTLGFRSRINQPRETVTVPATLEGARTAIQSQTAGIDSLSPDKTFPSQRVHPPAIEFGEKKSIPKAIRNDIDLSSIEITVPARLDELLLISPLSYYLQANISFADIESVRLTAPSLDGPLHLGRSSALTHDVAALIRRVFYLDCVVRNAGLHPVELRQSTLLDDLKLNGEEVYRQSNSERLATYLAADFSAVAERVPDWHLSTVIDPELATLPAIPHLLNRLSLIQIPAPVSVDRQSLVAKSVREAYASRTRKRGPGTGDDLVKNRTRLGKHQGWMTTGTPVDAFRATQTAFEARSKFYEQSSGPKRVIVVINDPAMIKEQDLVEDIYRDRSSELDMDVSVEESINCEELRDLFSSTIDFLHFIGHCDQNGLRCENGWVRAGSLETNNVQTFFLNACGSFREGLELVRRGSVAGAVTIADVLNREATQVGMTFARLIMHGFSVSRALNIAGRRSIKGKFYTVVGDGSHHLSQGVSPYPAKLFLERVDSNQYNLRFEFPQLNVAGGLAKPRVGEEPDFILRGSETTIKLDHQSLCDFLGSVQLPVMFENGFHWSTELADKVRTAVDREDSD